MTVRHVITNLGSEPIEVHLDRCIIDLQPGDNIAGVLVKIHHGDRRANYSVEPEERRYEPCRCAMRNKFELMARCPFPNQCKHKADRANGELVKKAED